MPGAPLRALVLGVEHPRAIAVLRSLSKGGIEVWALDHRPTAPGFFSRHAHKRQRLSPDPALATDQLESLGRTRGGLLIPTNDHYLVLVTNEFDRLSRLFAITTPPRHILGPVMDRSQSCELARRAGIRVPPFFSPTNEEELEAVLPKLDFACRSYLLKTPVWSLSPADPETGRLTTSAGADPASLSARWREIFSRTGHPPLITELVPGGIDRCIGVSMVVDARHEPVMTYCVRRLRLYTYEIGVRFVHPYELGATVYCESVHDREAIEASHRFVRLAQYRGLLSLEFKRDPADNALTFMKAEPRFIAATGLSTALGLDLPLALYGVFTGQRPDAASLSYEAGVAWVWPSQFLKAVWNDRARRSVRRELGDLFRNARGVRAVAYLSLRDPLPALVDLAGALVGTMRRRGRSANQSMGKPGGLLIHARL